MSYTQSTVPLMLHVVADDGAGMLFSAGSIGALFELGALTGMEVWSCSGLGCLVLSVLLTICEGLFDHTDIVYQLDAKDPIHRMAVEHFLSLMQEVVKELPRTRTSSVLIGWGTFQIQALELILVIVCSIALASIDLLPDGWESVYQFSIFFCLLGSTTAAWYRRRWLGGQLGRVIARYVCDSSMRYEDAGVLLVPTAPVSTSIDTDNDSAWQVETYAPLVVLTNSDVMPTMDRRTTQYTKLTSLRDGVRVAITSSAMALDQMLIGPLNAFYTYNRMPLRCTGGKTLVVVDAWSFGPAYCDEETTSTSAHKRMEDDLAILVGSPDTNCESVRLFTHKPISIVDTAYTVSDSQGNNLRSFYRKIHDGDANGPIEDTAMVRDLMNWGYIATCVLIGDSILNAKLAAMEAEYMNEGSSDEEKYGDGGSDMGRALHNSKKDSEDTREKLVTHRSDLQFVLDRRPFQSTTYFNIKQFSKYFPFLCIQELRFGTFQSAWNDFRGTVLSLDLFRMERGMQRTPN